MPKILPKSIPNPSSQNRASNQSRNENTENDVMFAAIFGDAKVETPSGESVVEKSLLVPTIPKKLDDKNVFADQESEEAFGGKQNDDFEN